MKNKVMKKMSVILLAICLVIPIAAVVAVKSNAETVSVEEKVYQEGYTKSILDLIEVKKAETGTDIDGDATNGGTSDLEQMRNHYVGKTSAFYRTQGVKYQYDADKTCYYVTSNQSCNAGITKADGTLTVLSAYNDGVNGEATVTTVAENAFLDCTDVTTAVLPKVTTLGEDAFKGCTGLKTAVVIDNFELTSSSFPDSDQSVDICVSGSYEPTLDMSKNAGLSGEIYHQNASGACDTWKYDEAGAVVKAQHKHTYDSNGVCTNSNCKKQSINGLAFEKNYFNPRTASSITVEEVASYKDKTKISNTQTGITETHVAKITTVGKYADFVIDLPEDVTDTLTVRILIPSSNATFIRFRTVAQNTAGNVAAGKECDFSGVSSLAANSALATENTNVWLDYTLDYSKTSKAYKDRLAMLVQGQGADDVNTFYIAYAINTDKIEEKLASDLTTGYLADFSSSLYEKTAGLNMIAGRTGASVTAQKIDSMMDNNDVIETNVMKITTVANSANAKVADFVLDLPKPVSNDGTKKVTVRMLVESSDATFIGFRNVENGAEAYSGTYPGSKSTVMEDKHKGVWMDVEVDYTKTDSDYMDRLAMLIQGGAAGGTHTFYIAYVVETDQIQTALAEDLPADYYVADFSSSLYQHMIKDSRISNTVETKWLPSYEGEEGVMKVVVTGNGVKNLDFDIILPKIHTGTYTLRMYIGSNTDSKLVGTQNSNGAFDKGGSYTAGEWKSYIYTANDSLNGEKISILGYDVAATHTTLEVYLAWILNGGDDVVTAEETWRANTTSATKATLKSTFGDGYLADFSSAEYASLVFGSSNLERDPKSIAASYVESYTDTNQVTHEGVLKVDIVGDKTGDFLIELPKSITQDKIKVRYAVVYGDETQDPTDYLWFIEPETTKPTGMYDTDGQLAKLIGDGAWHELDINWNCSVKDYLEILLSTDTSGETVTIYFDEVTEQIP